MIAVRTILCPVDMSETSGRALDYANMLARWYGASVNVMEVVWFGIPAVEGISPTNLTPEQLAGCAEGLRAFVQARGGAGSVVNTEVRQGAVVAEILAAADGLKADLIVMGTHGRGGFDRFVMGSFTEKVLRKSPRPVLTVPHGSVAASSTPQPFASILCPVDFSPASQKALEFALLLAQESGKRLTLLHAFDWPDRPEISGVGSEMPAERRQLQEAALREMRLAVPDEARLWCSCREIVAVGRPYETILRVADQEHADLIVMGVHGRTGLQLGFFGSTANQIVRHAKCPVLTIRP